MPVYNTGTIIRETIDSVLVQTSSDFELIVINDGSKRETSNIIKSYTDPRIRYYYQKNKGMAAARNRGIELARGECIAFLDHDDIWLPEKLETMIKLLRENEYKKIGMVYSQVKYLYPGALGSAQNEPIIPEERQYKELLLHNLIKSASCIIIPRFVFDDNQNLRFRDFAVPCDDYDFYLRLSLRYKIKYYPVPLVLYRCHSKNVSNNHEKMRHAKIQVLLAQYREVILLKQNKLERLKYLIDLSRTILWIIRHKREF